MNQTANFVVTGGTPPYSVFFASPRPGATIAPSSLGSSGQGFAVSGLTNGVLTTNITVADAGSPQLLQVATITCPLTSNPPPALVVTPVNYNYSASTCIGTTSNFVVTGGTPPYTAFFSAPSPGTISPSSIATSGGGFNVTGLTNGILLTQITVQDSGSPPLLQLVTLTCPVNGPGAPALVVTPVDGYNYNPTPALPDGNTCVNRTSNFIITGGVPPYTIAFPVPPNAGAVIIPTNVTTSGGGFAVQGLRDTTSAPNPGHFVTNVSITDSNLPPSVLVRAIKCP